MSLLDRIRTMGFNPVANGFSASAAMPEKLFPGGPVKFATNAARLGPLAAASVMAALAVYQKVKGPIEAFMRRHLQENPEQGARIRGPRGEKDAIRIRSGSSLAGSLRAARGTRAGRAKDALIS